MWGEIPPRKSRIAGYCPPTLYFCNETLQGIGRCSPLGQGSLCYEFHATAAAVFAILSVLGDP